MNTKYFRCRHNKVYFPTAMASFLKCPYCGREDFASIKGLQQHHQRNASCKHQVARSLQLPLAAPPIAHDYMQMTRVKTTTTSRSSQIGIEMSCNNTTTNIDSKQQTLVKYTAKHMFAEFNVESEEEDDIMIMDDESFGDVSAGAADAAA